MQSWKRFRRAAPAVLAAGLMMFSMAFPQAANAYRLRLMVRVSEAGVWTVPAYRPYARLIKTTHHGDCVVVETNSRYTYEGRLWLEVETASSPTGRGWMREDLLGRFPDRC